MSDKLTVTVHELAALLNIGRNKAYELTKTQGFPAIRFGRRVVIPLEGLRKWLDQNGFDGVQL